MVDLDLDLVNDVAVKTLVSALARPMRFISATESGDDILTIAGERYLIFPGHDDKAIMCLKCARWGKGLTEFLFGILDRDRSVEDLIRTFNRNHFYFHAEINPNGNLVLKHVFNISSEEEIKQKVYEFLSNMDQVAFDNDLLALRKHTY